MSASGWKNYKVGDLCQITSSKRIFAQEYVDAGIPFYRSKEIIEKALGKNVTECLFISIDRFNEIKIKFGAPQKGDILLSSVGNRSGIAYIVKDHDCDFYFKDGNLTWFRDFSDELYSEYLFYWFNSSLGQNLLNSIMIGFAQKALTIVGLSSLEIELPPLPTQTRIAATLSALDDKIELNSQTNATLEAIVQAIFKEWFVDFRFPGATGEMQDSELGPIPKGWWMGKLGDVCDNIRKTVHPKDVPAVTPYVGLEHISRKSLGLASWGLAGDVDSQKTHFEKYNILFGKLRPYFHKVCIAPLDGITSTDILIIEPIKSNYLSFCLNYLYSSELITFVSAVADGTRMPRVDWKSISNYEIVIPPEQFLSKFNEITFPFYKEIIENNNQSTILAQVRDSLLPKLISGESEV